MTQTGRETGRQRVRQAGRETGVSDSGRHTEIQETQKLKDSGVSDLTESERQGDRESDT